MHGPPLEETCAYDYLSCGARAVGMTHGYPDFVGSEAPDRHFMVTVWEPTRLVSTGLVLKH